MSRVTQSSLFDLARRSIASTQERLYAAQRQASSGLRLERPSDGPAESARLRSIDASLARLAGAESGTLRARAQLEAAESTLGEVGTLLARVKEVAVAGASEPLTGGERDAAATEVAAIRAQLVALANTRIDDVYVFGGFKTGDPPFPGGVFAGDDGRRQIEVLPGMRVTVNVSGARAFTVAGGLDVFALLEDLEADLRANDAPAVRDHLPEIDVVAGQVLGVRAEAGSRLTQLQSADTVRRETIARLEAARSGVRDVDAPTAFTRLVQTETALRAALDVAARIVQLTSRNV